MENRQAKQVIVFRHDLIKLRKGKLMAQASHASLGAVLGLMKKSFTNNEASLSLTYKKTSPLFEWLNGTFTKVVVGCEGEKELLELYKQAKDADLPCTLITDAGRTEFNGVPTRTCIAIGPAWAEEVDKITRELKLL